MNKEEREERGVRPDVRESYAFLAEYPNKGKPFFIWGDSSFR
jgi:hypothetical protein